MMANHLYMGFQFWMQPGLAKVATIERCSAENQ